MHVDELKVGMSVRTIITVDPFVSLVYKPRKVVYIEKLHKYGLLDKSGMVELVDNLPLGRTMLIHEGGCNYD